MSGEKDEELWKNLRKEKDLLKLEDELKQKLEREGTQDIIVDDLIAGEYNPKVEGSALEGRFDKGENLLKEVKGTEDPRCEQGRLGKL